MNNMECLKLNDGTDCRRCLAEMIPDDDYPNGGYRIVVLDANGTLLGYVQVKDADEWNELWSKLEQGACPICDGWEDGLGRTCTADGWGGIRQ